MQATVVEQTGLDAKINTNRARQRFLDHLARNMEDGVTDEDDECCILCRCEFNRGYITPWYVRRESLRTSALILNL
jgi:E3 ubiquitin-protein ligase SHPRH